MRIFEKEHDYEAFERILEETLERQPMRICAYCLMPNHWHLVLWPKKDGDLAAFMQRLTITHATRWQRHKHQVGYGHVYQGRFCHGSRKQKELLSRWSVPRSAGRREAAEIVSKAAQSRDRWSRPSIVRTARLRPGNAVRGAPPGFSRSGSFTRGRSPTCPGVDLPTARETAD